MNPTLDAATPTADDATPEGDWVEAGCYAGAREAFEHGLVVLAMGGEYWLRREPDGGGFRLLVPAGMEEPAREQLAIYERENAGWPPPPKTDAAGRTGWRAALVVALLWAWVTIGAFAAQQRWPRLTEAAAMDARAVFADGEGWRAFTALFLHADLGHLLSNLGGGVFLFATVLAVWGVRRGAALLALAATAANLLVAAIIYPEEYRSLGASTALFAALGLLTGRATRIVASAAASGKGRAMLPPLGAGFTLLMLHGAGEAGVDTPAHAAGFCVGLLVGLVRARGPVDGGRGPRSAGE